MNTLFSFPTGLKARSVLTLSSLVLGAAALLLAVVRPALVSMVSAAAPTACIITILGVQYDVTALGTMHSGPQGTTLDAGAGGFFQCGTDLSSAYQAQHGTNVSRLAPFVYVAPTATPTTAPNNTHTPTPSLAPNTIPTASPTPTPTGFPASTVSPTPTPTGTSGGTVRKDDDDHDEAEQDEEEHEVENEHEDESRESKEESDQGREHRDGKSVHDQTRRQERRDESED